MLLLKWTYLGKFGYTPPLPPRTKMGEAVPPDIITIDANKSEKVYDISQHRMLAKVAATAGKGGR